MSDEFQGDSGLKDDWDGTIIYSRFEQQSYGWALILKSKADDGDEVDHRPLSVGGKDKGWTSHDGGEEIMGATEKQKFHERSAIQQFINTVMETDANPVLRARSRERYNHRGPMYADLWLGLRFHWDIKQQTSQRSREVKKDDGTTETVWEDTVVQVMVPTKYLGEVDKPAQPTPVQQSLPSPTPSNGSLEELKLLASIYTDWAEFAEAAINKGLGKDPECRTLITKSRNEGEHWSQWIGAQ